MIAFASGDELLASLPTVFFVLFIVFTLAGFDTSDNRRW